MKGIEYLDKRVSEILKKLNCKTIDEAIQLINDVN